MSSLLSQMRNLAAGASLALLAGPALAAAPTADLKPEAGTVKLGMQPWLGYGQWYVAEDQGLFAGNGLQKVELINFNEDKDMNAALASGRIDAGNLATHTAMAMVAAGLPVKIVLLLDQATSADAIIVDPSITTVADLKGKAVAYEEGTTSDILLHSALAKAGMTLADIRPVPMPASSAGGALIAGQVPAAVTYEPYLTAAAQQNPKIRTLFQGSDDPGLISDVLVVREEMLEKRPGQVLALIRAWDAAYRHYQANPKQAQAVIARGVGASAEELGTAFAGVKFYSLADNQRDLQVQGEFINSSMRHITKAAGDAGLLPQPVSPAQLLDTRFVEALK